VGPDSLLNDFSVKCVKVSSQPLRFANNWDSWSWGPTQSTVTFPHFLEPPSALRKIKKVTIDGVEDTIFAAKLKSVMLGDKEKVLRKVEYDMIAYKRGRVGTHKKIRCTRIRKKFHEPQFDWESVNAIKESGGAPAR